MPRPASVPGEFRAGWPLLLASTVGVGVGVASLPFYTAGLFIGPLRAEFGWTRGAASSGGLALSLGIGLGAPLVGRLLDRFGAPRVVVPALVLQALAYVVLAFTGGSVVAFDATIFAMGLLGAGASPLAFTKVVNAHFVRARGLALGICLMGTGLAAAIAPPLLARLIAHFGWRAGYQVLAVVVIAAIPFAFLLKTPRTPAGEAMQSPKPPGRFLADARFWVLLAASVLAAASSAGIVVHFISILTDKGATEVAASSRAGLIGVAVLAARLLVGAALDRAPPPAIGGILMLSAACGALALRYGTLDASLFAALALGVAVGAEIDLISFLSARYFGLGAYGRAYGLIYGVTLLAAGAGPLGFGLLADRAGSYDAALSLGAGLLAAAGGLLLSLLWAAPKRLAG
jgi:predicted MFS family arabinose efflux permease